MSDYVVVDASLAVKWLVDEDDSDVAEALKDKWALEGVQIAALPLLYNEVANTLLQKIKQGKLTEAGAVWEMRRFTTFNIEYINLPEFHPHSIQLALRTGHPAAYDPSYLALAEHLGCEYWLADKKFYDRAHPAGYPVRFFLEHHESPPAPA